MTASHNSQIDIFKVHRKLINGLWHVRWWLLATAGLLAIIVVYTMPIKGHGTDELAVSEQWLRLKYAVLFNFLAIQLTAWFLCVLKAISAHQLKWIALLLLCPPAAFVYLIRYRVAH